MTFALQACGEMPANEGFTETDISQSNSKQQIQDDTCAVESKMDGSSDSRSPCRAKLMENDETDATALDEKTTEKIYHPRGTALVN